MTAGQYHLVRFVPDPARDEPVNIGIVMTGDFGPKVAFPIEAMERAARWCSALDREAFSSLRQTLELAFLRAASVAEDIGTAVRSDYLGEGFGPIVVSEPRWVDVDRTNSEAVDQLFNFLSDRLVKPPKAVVYGGGATPSEKLARDVVLPALRRQIPNAKLKEPLVGHSGRSVVADVYAEGPSPVVVATMALGSNWQARQAVEAKAFELYDVGRSMPRGATIAACCSFNPLDPERIKEDAQKVFSSIDVQLITPDRLAALRIRD